MGKKTTSREIECGDRATGGKLLLATGHGGVKGRGNAGNECLLRGVFKGHR